jgi:hypothetical protein
MCVVISHPAYDMGRLWTLTGKQNQELRWKVVPSQHGFLEDPTFKEQNGVMVHCQIKCWVVLTYSQGFHGSPMKKPMGNPSGNDWQWMTEWRNDLSTNWIGQLISRFISSWSIYMVHFTWFISDLSYHLVSPYLRSYSKWMVSQQWPKNSGSISPKTGPSGQEIHDEFGSSAFLGRAPCFIS